MRRALVFFCLIISAVGETRLAPGSVARAAAGELAQRNYALLHARFTPHMKVALPKETLASTLAQQLFASVGPFEKLDDDITCQPIDNMQACNVSFLFEQARVHLLLAIDAEGRVGGIRLLGREPRNKRASQ